MKLLKLIILLTFIFIINNKLSSQINLEWEQFHYGNSVWNTGLSIDQENNIYLSGLNLNKAFLIKYSNVGTFIWGINIPEINYTNISSTNILTDSNNNIYIIGNQAGINIIHKYSSNGNFIWGDTLNLGEYSLGSYTFTLDNNSNIVIIKSLDGLGGGFLIYKYSPDGTTLWYKKCHLPIIGYVAACKIDNNNSIYITGSTYGSFDDILTIKYNENGDSIWSKTYITGNYDHVFDISIDNSNKITITGESESQISGNYGKMTTIKYNSDGTELWNKKYSINSVSSDYGVSVKSDNLGNTYVAGNCINLVGNYDIVTIKYNQYGDSIWVKQFDSDYHFDDKVYDFIMDSLDNIYITGYSVKQNNKKEIILLKYTKNGELIRSMNYINSASLSGAYLLKDKNNNIIVSGSNLLNLSSNFSVCLKYSQVIGIKNISQFSTNHFNLYQNYPNPFNPVTNMIYDLLKDTEVTIKVFDLLGNVVFYVNEYKRAGSYEVRFDGSNLASGIYFYQMFADGFTDTKKMVLLK